MGLFGKKETAAPAFSDLQGVGASTAPESGAPPAPKVRTYTAVSGDSLSKIAKREYGDANRWRDIYEANRDRISNPDVIHPGQTLTIPPAS